jgi:RNA polymerase sigma-70 factor (ECF subfamily)
MLRSVRGVTPQAVQEDLMHTETAMPWRSAADTPDEDVVLVRAAQQDRAAFAPLYHRYRHRVYAYLYTRLPHAEDAADLTQQVFVQALAALPRYRLDGPPFAGWLFRIARNAAVDHQRRQRWGAMTLERVPEGLHPRADQDLEAQVVQQEALAHLHATLDRLDPATRDLLLLRFAGQLTVVEIGAAIGTSPAAASKRLQRALQTLKEQYHEPRD